jgi:hypothetical protein
MKQLYAVHHGKGYKCIATTFQWLIAMAMATDDPSAFGRRQGAMARLSPDVTTPMPRPYDSEFDSVYEPWLRKARVTDMRLITRSLWRFKLDASAMFQHEDATVRAKAAATFGSANQAFAVFRPLWGRRQREHNATELCSPDHQGKLFTTEVTSEILAFRLERILGIYRAPPIVFRCFDLEHGPGLWGPLYSDGYKPPAGPPEDTAIRHTIDKLAEFVAKNDGHGRSPHHFEDVVARREKDNDEFAFLRAGPEDTDRAYYKWLIATQTPDLQGQKVGERMAEVWTQMLADARLQRDEGDALHEVVAPSRVCGSLAIGVRGVTDRCPRLTNALRRGYAAGKAAHIERRRAAAEAAAANSSGAAAGSSKSSSGSRSSTGGGKQAAPTAGQTEVEPDDGALSELADLALFDAVSEQADRELKTDDNHSTAKLHNLHCNARGGALVIVDQGYAFRENRTIFNSHDSGAKTGKGSGLPFIDDWLLTNVTAALATSGGGRRSAAAMGRQGYHGLCVGASTRRAVLALGQGGAFDRRFSAAVRALEEEVLDALLGSGGKGGSLGGGNADGDAAPAAPAPVQALDEQRRLCGFSAKMVGRVMARFEHARRQVEGCVQSEASLEEWYATLYEHALQHAEATREHHALHHASRGT